MKHKKILISIIVFIGILFTMKNVYADTLNEKAIDDAITWFKKQYPSYEILSANCKKIEKVSSDVLIYQGKTDDLYQSRYKYEVAIEYKNSKNQGIYPAYRTIY